MMLILEWAKFALQLLAYAGFFPPFCSPLDTTTLLLTSLPDDVGKDLVAFLDFKSVGQLCPLRSTWMRYNHWKVVLQKELHRPPY